MMKRTHEHLIKVVMDGVTDAGMIAEYAEAAREEGHEMFHAWFAARARERLAMVKRDWGDVDKELGLHTHSEPLVNAMACHIDREIKDLEEEMENL